MIIQSASLSVVERRKPALGVSEMLAVDWISSTIKLWRIILRTFLVQLLNLPKALPSVNNPLQLLQNIFGLRQKPTKLLDWVQPELLRSTAVPTVPQFCQCLDNGSVLLLSPLFVLHQTVIRLIPGTDTWQSFWGRRQLILADSCSGGHCPHQTLFGDLYLEVWEFFKPLSILCEPASHNTMSSCWS